MHHLLQIFSVFKLAAQTVFMVSVSQRALSVGQRVPRSVTAVITADRKWLCLSGASVGDDIIGICLGLFLSLLFTCAVERKLMSVLVS